MGFELQLTDGQVEALRDRAESEGRSIEDVVSTAISDYIARFDGQRVRKAVEQIRTEDADLLNRLSE